MLEIYKPLCIEENIFDFHFICFNNSIIFSWSIIHKTSIIQPTLIEHDK